MSFFEPSWISSSKTIVAPGQPMPVPWTETGLPFHVPVKPRRPRSSFTCSTSSRYVSAMYLGAKWVAGEKDGVGVIAGLGTEIMGVAATLSV